MQANTFDVIERRKHIIFFKLGKLRVQVHRREEQCLQAPGAKWLRLRPGGGPERLRGPGSPSTPSMPRS